MVWQTDGYLFVNYVWAWCVVALKNSHGFGEILCHFMHLQMYKFLCNSCMSLSDCLFFFGCYDNLCQCHDVVDVSMVYSCLISAIIGQCSYSTWVMPSLAHMSHSSSHFLQSSVNCFFCIFTKQVWSGTVMFLPSLSFLSLLSNPL